MNDLIRGRQILPALAIAASLVVAACGGGASATRAPAAGGGSTTTGEATPATQTETGIDGPKGLCGLVSRDEAAAALGEAVGAGKPKRSTTFSNSYHCRYTGTDSDNVLDLEFEPEKTRAEWDEDMDGVGMLDETALAGVGEAAWRSDDAALGPGTRLAAYDDGLAIWVVMYKDGDQPTMYSGAEELAKAMLTRLEALPAAASATKAPAGP